MIVHLLERTLLIVSIALLVSPLGCKKPVATESFLKHSPENFQSVSFDELFTDDMPVTCLGGLFQDERCEDKVRPSWAHPLPGARINDVYFRKTNAAGVVRKTKHQGIDLSYAQELVPERFYQPLGYLFLKLWPKDLDLFKSSNNQVRYGLSHTSTLARFTETDTIVQKRYTNRSPVFLAYSGKVLKTGKYSNSAGHHVYVITMLPDDYILTPRQRKIFGYDSPINAFFTYTIKDLKDRNKAIDTMEEKNKDLRKKMLVVSQSYFHFTRPAFTNETVMDADQDEVTEDVTAESITIKGGQILESGSLIGLAGNSGRGVHPHLHFELQFEVIEELASGGIRLEPTKEYFYPFQESHPSKPYKRGNEPFKLPIPDILNETCLSEKIMRAEDLKDNWYKETFGDTTENCTHLALIPSIKASSDLWRRYEYSEHKEIPIACEFAGQACQHFYVSRSTERDAANLRPISLDKEFCGTPLKEGEWIKVHATEKVNGYHQVLLSPAQINTYQVDTTREDCQKIYVYQNNITLLKPN